MDQHIFQRAIGLLSRKPNLSILQLLRDGNWHPLEP